MKGVTIAVVDEAFIRQRTSEFRLGDGTRVVIRPITPEDKDRIRDGFEHLSEESRYRRFMSPMVRLTARDLAYLTEIDYVDHFAFGALAADEPGMPGVGVARYIRLRDEPEVADAAIAVVDDYQKRGLGTLLLRALGAVALENGIRSFRSELLSENVPVQELLKNLGGRLERHAPGVMRVTVDLPAQMDQVRGTPLFDVLRAVACGEAPPMRIPEGDQAPS